MPHPLGTHSPTPPPAMTRYYFTYMVTLSLVGGAIIASLDGLPYVDGLFLSSSAVTCTGLFTVSMSDLHTGSFITISVLSLFGGTIFLLIPPLLYRR